MDVVETLATPYPAADVFTVIADLGEYPSWLSIVSRATPEVDDEHTWTVDLQGRIGKFARSKRLRIVRSEMVEAQSIRFERRELDGRAHSEWRLDVAVQSQGDGSHVEMRLFYGGRFWDPVLERLLGAEIARGRERLLERLGEVSSRS